MSLRARIGSGLLTAALFLVAFAPGSAQADFGIKSMSAGVFEENGQVAQRAGSHPYEFRFGFEINQDSEERPEGTLRGLILDLPPGMVGNPFAVPRCSGADFEGAIPHCPGNTQVGTALVHVFSIEEPARVPLYNLTPPLGVPASVGVSIVNFNAFNEASLRSSDYGVRVSDITLPTSIKIQSVDARIWGIPPEPSHDADRICFTPDGKGIIEGCPSDSAPIPFLSLPTACAGPLKWTLNVESLEEPELLHPASVESLGPGGTPRGLIGCDAPQFIPTIVSRPEVTTADSATGLNFTLRNPQNEDPEQVSAAHLKDTVVTLPVGLTLNASAADGRMGCPLQGPEGINLSSVGDPAASEPAKCPQGSKVGTVTVRSPLLDHPAQGSVFIARQGENPFGSLIALYVAVEDPETGVVVKLAGKVEPDPVTGQLRTVFRNNPQLPFESFEFNFSGGPRAPLTTPPACGTYTTTAQLTPWTSPFAPDAVRTSSFPVTSAPGGGPCAPTEAQMPNNPSFEAASEVPLAGSFSPFALRLSRENGSQRFAALNTTLPTGLSAKLAGVTECSEAQIAQAQARGNPGQGALEKQRPSCPVSSRIGTVNVGAGSGNPIFVQGTAYLAGPYKSGPLSIIIITPGVAGPFDLGTVVVRAALEVNEETAQVTVKSDPIPQILEGIPLDVRTVIFKADRENFSLNPTSCDEKQVTGQEVSTTGTIAKLKSRFQVGGCRGLDYTPKLSLSMKGETRRSGHPRLQGVLTQPKNQANSRRITMILPPTEFIDPLRTANPCTRPQFAEGKCPPASILGTARVFTPLLDEPLEGKIYFRANGGARALPDTVLDLHGQVHFVQVGFVDAVHKKGSERSRVRVIFNNIPDAPLTKAIFQLKGGKKGTLVNSANLCKVPPVATVKMTAQNNKAQDTEKRIGTSCP